MQFFQSLRTILRHYRNSSILQIFHLVQMTHFWNNTHSQRIGKPNYLKVFRSKLTKESKRVIQILLWFHVAVPEGDFSAIVLINYLIQELHVSKIHIYNIPTTRRVKTSGNNRGIAQTIVITALKQLKLIFSK